MKVKSERKWLESVDSKVTRGVRLKLKYSETKGKIRRRRVGESDETNQKKKSKKKKVLIEKIQLKMRKVGGKERLRRFEGKKFLERCLQ
jgi:hypothetical protein